jgi:hypothetical protein
MRFLAVLAFALLGSSAALADGDHPEAPGPSTDGDHPQVLGGCWDGGKWCAGPAAALPVVAMNLKTGKVMAGTDAVSLGPCYGVMWSKGTWHSLGADVCLSVSFGQDKPTTIMPSLMFHLTDWGYLGLGSLGQEGDSGLFWQGVLLLGARLGL